MMSGLTPPVHQTFRQACPAPPHAMRVDLVSGEACGWAVPGGGLTAACHGAVARDYDRLSVGVPRLSARRVAQALQRSGLPPGRLEVVLCAAGLRDGVDLLLEASAVRDLGVGLAIDGYGASPALLRRLPLTAVVLGGALVHALPDGQEEVELAGAVVQTGHALGLTVVAQGIETEAQRRCLAALGCSQGEGPLFGTVYQGLGYRCFTCGTARPAPASRDDREPELRRAGASRH